MPQPINLSPAVPAELAMDLADPDSELNQFVDAFFTDYLLSHVAPEQQDATLEQWSQLSNEDDQIAFLHQIDPNFNHNFQTALTKELLQLFKQTTEQIQSNIT